MLVQRRPRMIGAMASVRDPRVLVLTLYSGEGEIKRCRASVLSQALPVAEHRVFEHLPNRAAHDRLYHTIMTESSRFDLFLKLDADMELADEGALGRLLGPFRRVDGLDHLVAAVDDWMTGTDMIGIHVFSARVRWADHDEQLYVDPDPVFPGVELVMPAPRPPIVHHAFDPTPLQAFRFGVHRGLKAVQRGRSRAITRPHNAILQMKVLSRVWRRFTALGDRRLGLAVMGADMVFRDRFPFAVNDYSDPKLDVRLGEFQGADAGSILTQLRPRWGTAFLRRSAWMRALDPVLRVAVLGRLLRDGVTWPVRRALVGRPRRPRRPAADPVRVRSR